MGKDIPRKHHYVPVFLLKRFTNTGAEDGTLWVTDILRKTLRKTTPKGTGFEKDFYRVDVPNLDPMFFEKMMASKIEPELGRVLQKILYTRRIPRSGDDWCAFLNLVATSVIRVPLMRKMFTQSVDSNIRAELKDKIGREGAHQRLETTLAESGEPAPEQLATFLDDTENYTIDVDRGTHIRALSQLAQVALDAFAQRQWIVRQVGVSGPNLICSDDPVGAIALKPKIKLSYPDGIWTHGDVLIVLPLSLRVVAVGSMHRRQVEEDLSEKQVVAINDAVMRGATQIYSADRSFAISTTIGDLRSI